MKRIQFSHTYEEIISVENLLDAWKEFVRGKRRKEGVQRFQLRLMEHILALHVDLCNRTYRHGPYRHFKVSDPKPRDIHKASVRDRLLHRALYRKLYPFFDRTFIADSFSCRLGKGTHRAMNRFRAFAYKASRNHTRTCFVLECDIRKFFANINHEILFSMLAAYIPNADILGLLKHVVGNFSSIAAGTGLPLGNLTSQLLVNIYMNEFDQFMKHTLKATYYIRYADDFVILHPDKKVLNECLCKISGFLQTRLRLSLHPDKVFIKTVYSGVDFLGWVHFPHHRVLRTTIRRRTLARVNEQNLDSYLGLCKHGNEFTLKELIAHTVQENGTGDSQFS